MTPPQTLPPSGPRAMSAKPRPRSDGGSDASGDSPASTLKPVVSVKGSGFKDSKTFKLAADALRSYEPDELLAIMDPLGVDKAILGIHGEVPEREVLAFVDRYTLFANMPKGV